MNTRHGATAANSGLRISEGVLGVLGVVAAIAGLIILVAGDDQYVGLGGEASWRVGDLSLAWGVGLLAVGAVVVLLDVALVRWDRQHGAGTAVARSSRTDLAVHATAFVLVNAVIWAQDLAIGGGVDYAYWVTIPWALGLAVHAAAVWRDRGGTRGR